MYSSKDQTWKSIGRFYRMRLWKTRKDFRNVFWHYKVTKLYRFELYMDFCMAFVFIIKQLSMEFKGVGGYVCT